MAPSNPTRITWGSATVALAVASFCLVTASLAAGLPRLIPFQGRLTDGNNNPVPDGPAQITFSIYEQAVDPTPGPTPKWFEQLTVPVQNGQINVILGSQKKFDDPNGDADTSDGLDFTNKKYFLGIKIGNGAELAPRQELIPSFHARIADAVAVNSISGASIQAGTITTANIGDGQVQANDIATDAVTTAKILDGQVKTADIGDGEVKSADIGSGEIKTINIGGGAVTAANLAADVRTSVAPFDVHAKIRDNASVVLAATEVPGKIFGPGPQLVLEHGTALMPIDNSQGLSFTITRAGSYEACVEFPLSRNIFLRVSPENIYDVRLSASFRLDSNADYPSGGQGVGHSYTHYLRNQNAPSLVAFNDAGTEQVNFCQVFRYDSAFGEKTMNVMYTMDQFNGNASAACPMPDPCNLSVDIAFTYRIRELVN